MKNFLILTICTSILFFSCSSDSSERTKPKEKETEYYIKFRAGGKDYDIRNVNNMINSHNGTVSSTELQGVYSMAANFNSNEQPANVIVSVKASSPIKVQVYPQTTGSTSGFLSMVLGYPYSPQESVVEVVELTKTYTKMKFSGKLRTTSQPYQYIDVSAGEVKFPNWP